MHRKFFALAALLALAAPAAQADYIIDDFSQGTQLLDGTGFSETGSLAGVLGGTRSVSLTVGTVPNPFSSASLLVYDGTLTLSNDFGVSSTGSIRYDGGGAGLGGFDAVAEGNQIALDLLGADSSVVFTVSVVDTLGGSSVLSYSAPGLGLLSFAFADFLGSADFLSLASIEIGFEAPSGSDFSLTLLGITGGAVAVPEPASASLTGIGLIVAVFIARRRRTARG